MAHPSDDISLKELIISLFDAEKEFTRQAFGGIQKQFEQQEKNVAFALASQKELSQNVQTSSDKAILKAEDAQKLYNQGHNDLSRKMEDQYKQMLPRTEADQRQINQEEKLEAHRKEIADLRTKIEGLLVRGSVAQPLQDKSFDQIEDLLQTRSARSGRDEGMGKVIAWVIAGIGILIGLSGFIFAVVTRIK